MDQVGFLRDRSRIAWWVFALFLGVLLLYVISSYLGAFVLGVFIYYATRPIYDRVGTSFRPKSLQVVIALLTISLPVLALVGYTAFSLVVSLQDLGIPVGTNFDTFRPLLAPHFDLRNIHTWNEFVTYLTSHPETIGKFVDPAVVGELLGSVEKYLAVLFSGLIQVFIALAVAFYLLRDDHKLAGWTRTALCREDETLIAYGRAVDRDLKTIYFGNILNAFVVAVVASIIYNTLNIIAPSGVAIPAPTLLGLLTGAASLIPVVGMKIVYGPVALYLGVIAARSDPGLLWFPIVVAVVSVALIDGLTELLLRPYISGRNLHVGLVLFAYILGPLIFGWYGLFFGPLILVLAVHLARMVLPELVHGEPLNPNAIGADPIPDANGDDTIPDEIDGDDEPDTEPSATDGGEEDEPED